MSGQIPPGPNYPKATPTDIKVESLWQLSDPGPSPSWAMLVDEYMYLGDGRAFVFPDLILDRPDPSGSTRFQIRLRRESRPGFEAIGIEAIPVTGAIGLSEVLTFDGPGVYILEIFDSGSDAVVLSRVANLPLTGGCL